MASHAQYSDAVFGAALAPALLLGAVVFGGTLIGGGLYAGAAAFAVVTMAFIVALPHAAILGLPVMALFARFGWVNAITAVAAGFAIGSLPLGLITTLSHPTYRVVVNDLIVSSVEAEWTGQERITQLKLAGVAGLFGDLGGLSAWLMWRGGVWATRLRFAGSMIMGAIVIETLVAFVVWLVRMAFGG